MIRIAAFVALLLAPFARPSDVVLAHEWYPVECCSDNDCAPIPLAETPIEKDGGFTLTDGRHVEYKSKRLRSSPDGKWHLCEQKWPTEPTSDRKILCLYAPLGGV